MRTRAELGEIMLRLKPHIIEIDGFDSLSKSIRLAGIAITFGWRWPPEAADDLYRARQSHPNSHVRRLARDLIFYRFRLPTIEEENASPIAKLFAAKVQDAAMRAEWSEAGGKP